MKKVILLLVVLALVVPATAMAATGARLGPIVQRRSSSFAKTASDAVVSLAVTVPDEQATAMATSPGAWW